MKHFIVAAAVLPLTIVAPSSIAQTVDDGIYPVSSIDSVSEYVFRGVSLGGASLQPSTEIGTSFGLTGGVWYSAGIGSDSDVQVDEINLYASYDIPLELPVSLSVGGTYYFFPQFGSLFETDGGAGSYEINGTASLDDVLLSPSATVYYDFTLENLTIEGSLSHSIDLPREGWSADLGLTGGFVDADQTVDYEWVTATVALAKDITENINFYVSGNFTLNSEDDSLGFDREVDPDTDIASSTLDSDTQFWIGTGLSVSY